MTNRTHLSSKHTGSNEFEAERKTELPYVNSRFQGEQKRASSVGLGDSF